MSTWDQNALLRQCRKVYATRVWPRLIAMVLLVGAALLLLRLSGGFPPAAWLFLLHVVPDVPRLWLLRGPAILLPLGGLAALAGTLALAWAVLLRMAWIVVLPCKQCKLGQQKAALQTQLRQREEGEACASPLTDSKGEQVRCAVGDNDTPFSSEVSSASELESGCCRAAEGNHEPLLVQQAPGEADEPFGVGSCLHLAKHLQWREDGLFVTQGRLVTRSRTVPYGLFIVADGVGGHRLTGHDACQLVLEAATSHILAALTRAGKPESAWDEQRLVALVAGGVQAANRALCQGNQEHHAYMEGSMTVCCVVDTTAYAASMGETLAFLFRESSGLQRMAGEPRCLGEQEQVPVASEIVSLQTGDTLLLCTDGLWKMVSDHHVAQVLGMSEFSHLEKSKELVQGALENGSEDHIACVVVHC